MFHWAARNLVRHDFLRQGKTSRFLSGSRLLLLSQSDLSKAGGEEEGLRPASRHVQKIRAALSEAAIWGPVVERSLIELAPDIKPYYITRVLQDQKDGSLALSFFRWVKRVQPGFKHEPPAYITLLLLLARSKYFDAMQDLLEEIKTEGISIQGDARVIDSVVQLLMESQEWEKTAETLCTMKRLGADLDVRFLTLVISSLVKAGASEPALVCYKLLLDIGGTLTLDGYIGLLKSLDKDRNVRKIFQLFKDMSRRGVRPDKLVYNICIGSFGRAGRTDISKKFYERMRKQGLEPDEISESALIKSLCSAGKLEEAQGFLEEVEHRGDRPSIMAYNTLIYGLGKHGRVDEACKTFDELSAKGCTPPRTDTYNALLTAYKNNGKIVNAFKLFEGMRRAGVKPSLYTYNILVDVISKAGPSEELAEMQEIVPEDEYLREIASEEGRSGVLTTCNVVIASLCRRGMLDDSLNLLSAMISKGLAPDNYTYGSLIQGLGKHGRISEACKLLEDMLSAGIQPNVIVYSSLMNAVSKAGKVEDACKFFDEMCSKGGLELDLVAYNTMISCVGKSGDLDKAFSLLRRLKEKGLKPDRYTHSALISSLLHLGKVDEACTLFEAMNEEGYKPEVILYNMLIKGLCSSNRLRQGFEYYLQMRKKGILPSVVTYATLIDGLGKAGLLDDAFSVFEQMKVDGCEPNIYVYGSLMDSLGKRKRLNDVYNLLDDLIARGLTPNAHTLNALLYPLAKLRETEEALNLFKWVQEKGCQPNSVSYCILIDAHVSTSNFEKAFSVLSEMDAKGWHPNIVAHTTIINGLVKSGQIDKAYIHFRDVIDNKRCKPDAMVYNTLIFGLAKAGEVNKSVELIEEMTAKHMNVTEAVFKALFNALKDSDNIHLASKVIKNIDKFLTVGKLVHGKPPVPKVELCQHTQIDLKGVAAPVKWKFRSSSYRLIRVLLQSLGSNGKRGGQK